MEPSELLTRRIALTSITGREALFIDIDDTITPDGVWRVRSWEGIEELLLKK